MADLIAGESRPTREGEAVPAAAGASDLDVLVVGAGPTGLLTAVELLRRGIRVRVIDRAVEPMLTPKALSVWPRALDILEDTGLGGVVDEESVRINTLSYFSERRPLASFGFSDDLACRTLPQHVTERLLTERLQALGGKIERGCGCSPWTGWTTPAGSRPPTASRRCWRPPRGCSGCGCRSSSAPTVPAAPSGASSASDSRDRRTRWPSRSSMHASMGTYLRTSATSTSPRTARW